MNKYFYLALLFFIPSIVLAQSNYKPGSIVDLKGDTIHGFIDYKEWVQNPESIAFKPEQNGKSKQLGVDDIQYFGVTGYEYYRRYSVNISLNSTEISMLRDTADTTTKTASVFLKVLQTGKNATLFEYNDDLKIRFYVGDKSNPHPAELIYLLYLNTDGSTVITKKYYQGQLAVIASDNHLNLSGQIENADYDESSLTEIIEKINGGQNSLSLANRPSSFRFFAGVAGGSSMLTFKGDAASAIITGSSTSFSPQVALGFDAYLNPGVGEFVLRVELSASSASYSVTGSSPGVSTAITEITSEKLKQYTIGLSPMILYNFYNKDAVKIYFGAGVKAIVATYPTNVYSISSDDNGTITPENGFTQKLQTETIYFSIPIKAGVVINKNLEIYAAYYALGSIASYETTSSNVSIIQIGLNYIFGR